MVPSDADSLIDGLSGGPNRPVSLHIESGGSVADFFGIYVLGRSPAASPHVARVILADRRIWWSSFHIGPRRYNWRRRTGFKRLASPDTPDVVQDVVPTVWYADWSLLDLETWDARSILENVIETVVQKEKDFNGQEPAVHFDDEPPREMPVENLLIDDSAGQSLARALGNLPEMDVYIDEVGDIHFYDKSSGGERDLYRDALPEKVGGGHVEEIRNNLMRPSSVTCLFTREVEIRIDFEEEATYEDTTTRVGRYDGTRTAFNVLQNPDFISESGMPSGSWMHFDTALEEWNKAGVPGFGEIDYPLIRKAMVPFMDLWSGILNLGKSDPDVDWMARIQAIVQNYRRTFMIDQVFWQRILSVHAYRVAIIDRETGARAPASVWANFARLGTQRSFFRDVQGKVDLSYAMNVKSYPDKAGNGPDPADEFPIKGNPEAAARVTISDPDQGVIHIDFLADANNMYESCLPSMIGVPPFSTNPGEPKNPGPTANVKDRNRPFTFDAISEKMANGNFDAVVQLAPNHRIALIITAIPASWSKGIPILDVTTRDNQLERVKIEPNDGALRNIISSQVAASIQSASGPPLEVRIGAGVEVARVGWVDSRAKDIMRIFGMASDGGNDDQEPDLTGLVVNLGDSNDKGASLNQIALAVAASVYSGNVDHLQGAMTSNFRPAMRPGGWMDEVSHELATSGEGSTQLDFPEKLETVDMMAYMDPSTRATLLKLAQPGLNF